MFGSPSTFLYLKFLVVWALVLLADFVLEFRFEYLWPFWLFLRSVYDSFKYQGLVSGTDLFSSFRLLDEIITYGCALISQHTDCKNTRRRKDKSHDLLFKN